MPVYLLERDGDAGHMKWGRCSSVQRFGVGAEWLVYGMDRRTEDFWNILGLCEYFRMMYVVHGILALLRST